MILSYIVDIKFSVRRSVGSKGILMRVTQRLPRMDKNCLGFWQTQNIQAIFVLSCIIDIFTSITKVVNDCALSYPKYNFICNIK